MNTASKLKILLSFALRDVSKSRTVLSLTIVSLTAAFTAIFFTGGILSGFRDTLQRGATDTTGHLTIFPKGEDESIENISEVSDRLAKTSNVESFNVRSSGAVIFEYGDLKLGPYAAVGFDSGREMKTTKLPMDIVKGRFLSNGDSNSVVLGATLADALVGLEYDGRTIPIGDKVTLTSSTGHRKDYRVVGILDAKTFQPNWVTYFTKGELEKFDSNNKDNAIAVKLKDPSKIAETKRELEKMKLGVTVLTWSEEAGFIDDIISAVEFVTGNISNLLIVAVFVITSVIIFINVFQKRRQIGILKSMGASNRFIIAIYMVETLIYSTLSFVLGFLFFVLITLQSVKNPIPLLIGDFYIVFSPKDVLASLTILFLASIAGSFLPALSAARTRIVDVIRNSV